MNLFSVVQKVKGFTDSVIVGFSGGKDAIVALDLCIKHFKKVEAYFLYTVKGLGFQERYLRYCEKKYKINIHRLPHYALSDYYYYAKYRQPTKTTDECKKINQEDIINYVREITGLEWCALGLKVADSFQRRWIVHEVTKHTGIDLKNKKFYPVAYFSNAHIYNYLKINNILLPPDYGMFGCVGNSSFGELIGKDLIVIKERYPEDYKKILEVFPFAEAGVKKEEFRSESLSKVRGSHNTPEPNKKRSVQSQGNR